MSSNFSSPSTRISGDGPDTDRRQRILLVEDESITLEFMQELLGAHYTVEAAPDGQAALDAVARGPLPDLILSDIAMPRLDGLGLLRALRADPRTTRIPVVLITAHDDEATRLMGLEEQADDFIGKPVRRRELYVRVRSVLARAGHRREARDREESLRADLAQMQKSAGGPDRETREALHACEQRCVAIASQAAVGVAWIDMTGRITQADPRFCEITGYAADELISHLLLRFTHPDDAPREETLLERLFAEGRGFDLEKRCVRKNGPPIWVRGGVVPLRDREGRMHSALAVSVDISGQREVRERLRENETQVSAMFTQAAAGISEITLDGHFLRANDQLCRMLGRTRAQMLASSVAVVTHPEDEAHSLRAFQKLVETGVPVTIDKRYLHADGTVVWASSSLTRLNDGWGNPRGVLAVTLDATGRVLAERALQGAVECLHTIAGEMGNPAVLTVDARGLVSSWSPGAETIYGYTAPEILGQPAGVLLTPEDRATGVAEIQAAAALQEGHTSCNGWQFRRDGTRCWASGVIVPLHEQGRHTGFLKILRERESPAECPNDTVFAR